MEKKHNIDILNISDKQKITHENKMKTLDDFKSMSFEEIIINYHKKDATTTRYVFSEDNSLNSNKIVILLTQDNDLITELKLPTYSREESPNVSYELFDDHGLKNVQLNNILNDMSEHAKIDFLYNFDSRSYSISVAQGKYAKKLIKSVDLYVEEIENMMEYSTEKKTNLKI